MSLKVDLSQGKGLINESRRKQSRENILTEETVNKVPEAADKSAEVGEMRGRVEQQEAHRDQQRTCLDAVGSANSHGKDKLMPVHCPSMQAGTHPTQGIGPHPSWGC